MQARTPTAEIFTALRDRICLLQYPPGSRLREAELAAEFGVSRTPIRAALQGLAHSGLIESRDGVGTIVTDPDIDEVRDIYQMRLRIAESIGLMNPRPFDKQQIESIAVLLQRAEAMSEHFDINEYWQINHDLHFLIQGVIGNTALAQIWEHLYFQSARMWYQHVRQYPAQEAAALVNELVEVQRAMIAGDAVALGYIQRNNIAYGLAKLEAKYQPSDIKQCLHSQD